MRLNDDQLLDVIKELDTATLSQIYARVMDIYPTQDRTRERIGAMLSSLIRYKFVGYVDVGIYRYYHIYGITPTITPQPNNRARVSGFLTAQAPQAFTIREIAEHVDLSVRQVRYVIRDSDFKRAGSPQAPRYYVEVA